MTPPDRDEWERLYRAKTEAQAAVDAHFDELWQATWSSDHFVVRDGRPLDLAFADEHEKLTVVRDAAEHAFMGYAQGRR
jgi:hypothetical protein